MNRGATVAGVIFVALGVVLLLDTLGAFDLRLDVVLPVALIAGGLAVLLTARGRA